MIKRFIVILVLVFTGITTAQEGTSSPYSFYGVGLTTFKGSVENRSMGGLGVYSDSIHLNLSNPASLGDLRLTTYTIAGTYSSLNLKSATESESAAVTTLDYLAIGIPVNRWAFSFGLVPFTSVGYRIQNIDEATGTGGRYSGRGGLNKVFLAAGYALSKNFNVGAEVGYGFGNVDNTSIFVREGVQYASREINESRLSGFSYKLALNYQQMLNDKLELRATGVYAPESNLKSFNSRNIAVIGLASDGSEIIGDNGTAITEVDVADSEFTMASQYSFGLGIGQPRKWFLGAEYSAKEPSFYTNRSFNPEGAVFTDATAYRLGGFYIPSYNRISGYFNRVVYRAGVRMEETGLELEGEPIKEFGISFGVGLPAGRSFENVNLGFEYGQRGTTNAGLIQEDFLNLSISLSLNDKWFVKSKFD